MTMKAANSDFINRIKKSGMADDAKFAVIFDILSNDDSLKLCAEYEKDFAIPLLVSEMVSGPFGNPGNEADGMFRFAITKSGQAVGINPNECHVLIAGQTGTGKSTLLKLIFAQAIRQGETQKGKQKKGKNNGKNNLLAISQGTGHEGTA